MKTKLNSFPITLFEINVYKKPSDDRKIFGRN